MCVLSCVVLGVCVILCCLRCVLSCVVLGVLFISCGGFLFLFLLAVSGKNKNPNLRSWGKMFFTLFFFGGGVVGPGADIPGPSPAFAGWSAWLRDDGSEGRTKYETIKEDIIMNNKTFIRLYRHISYDR